MDSPTAQALEHHLKPHTLLTKPQPGFTASNGTSPGETLRPAGPARMRPRNLPLVCRAACRHRHLLRVDASGLAGLTPAPESPAARASQPCQQPLPETHATNNTSLLKTLENSEVFLAFLSLAFGLSANVGGYASERAPTLPTSRDLHRRVRRQLSPRGPRASLLQTPGSTSRPATAARVTQHAGWLFLSVLSETQSPGGPAPGHLAESGHSHGALCSPCPSRAGLLAASFPCPGRQTATARCSPLTSLSA